MSDHQPPIFDDPDDGSEVNQEELQRLQRQAHELGLHINSKDPLELEALIALAGRERGSDHPVPCYGQSYDPTDRRCRVCQLRSKCRELDPRPRVEVVELSQLQAVVCEVCGGSLEVELLDRESREIRDYGCTTTGCLNTLGIQCGWEGHQDQLARIVVLPKDEQEKAEPEDAATTSPPSSEEAPPASPSTKTAKKKTAKKKAAKKKAAKKVVVKGDDPDEPGPSEPKKSKKVVVKTRKVSAPEPGTSGIVYVYEGEHYTTLTPIAVRISGSRNWSGKKFFKVKGEPAAGTKLERKWEGVIHVVQVERKE